MFAFEKLPRELRDLIYGYAAGNEESILIYAGDNSHTLVTGRDSTAILLTSQQLHAEYSEVLMRSARTVLCYDKSQVKDGVANRTEPIPTQHTRTITVIIELDGLRPEGWQAAGESSAIGPELEAAASQLENTINTFPNLESIEVQWWHDLSAASDRSSLGEWIGALLANGLMETHELWFGYFGGKLKLPVELREHLLSHLGSQRRKTRAMPVDGAFRLIPPGMQGYTGVRAPAMTPMPLA